MFHHHPSCTLLSSSLRNLCPFMSLTSPFRRRGFELINGFKSCVRRLPPGVCFSISNTSSGTIDCGVVPNVAWRKGRDDWNSGGECDILYCSTMLQFNSTKRRSATVISVDYESVS